MASPLTIETAVSAMRAKHLLSLLVVLSQTALADMSEELAGIWHTEIEIIGLRAALEFELRPSPEDPEWVGRWEMLELTAWGDLQRVHIDGAAVELDMLASIGFKGVLTPKDRSLDGVLDFEGRELPAVFVKVDTWATQMPARTDHQGLAQTTWDYHPPDGLGDGWPVSSLNEDEIQDLDELFEQVVGGDYQGLDAVLVAREGQLVLEEYFHFGDRNEIHTLQSVTKSVTSLVFGSAYDDGLIADLDQPLHRYYEGYADSQWVKDKYPISLKHVLTMSAGLDWHEEGISYTNSRNDNWRMNRSGDMYGYILSRDRAGDVEPGDQFAYTSGLSILLGGVVLEATGTRIDRYAEQTLFEKMRINRYHWGAPSGQIHTGGGLYLRARDLLKLGQLVLDNGRWNGKQVISASWIEESTAFQVPRPNSGNDSSYGYQWWRTLLYTPRGSVQVIYASGYGGQLLWVFPKLELVMLVLHHNPRPGEGSHTINLQEVHDHVIPALASSKLTGFCIFRICF
jgi:CubicO group peptidase (beta-lactamase class C family)|tara:strand:- start:4961 stop:6496 length:1536 start_codon:yes stop_codon:yes gene_type:complete